VTSEERDGPRDECGVFGIYAPERDVSRLAYFALYALQHRGQESAGIAAVDRGGHIMTQRDLGLVSQVFDEQSLRALGGDLVVGHVRYSTTGSNAWENSQPVWRSDRHEIALAHNGNLTNAVELHAELRERGVAFSSTSDSEIIAALIATHPADRVEDAIADILPRLRGAFSTVVLTRDKVIGFRDPAGLRPLALGQLGDRYCLASESCAFDIINATLLRDVMPGEMVCLGERGISTRQVVQGAREAFCVFEYIYFARPDSMLEGKSVYEARKRIGRGNTTRQIVQMLRVAGASEVHMRISAPPIRHPCHYGIDMSTREEMIAHDRTPEEVAAELGCDTLHYLSLDGVYEAVRGSRDTHCDACFSGHYPLEDGESANGKFALELPLVRA
jgi:amidophosphoribosyltransferase